MKNVRKWGFLPFSPLMGSPRLAVKMGLAFEGFASADQDETTFEVRTTTIMVATSFSRLSETDWNNLLCFGLNPCSLELNTLLWERKNGVIILKNGHDFAISNSLAASALSWWWLTQFVSWCLLLVGRNWGDRGSGWPFSKSYLFLLSFLIDNCYSYFAKHKIHAPRYDNALVYLLY